MAEVPWLDAQEQAAWRAYLRGGRRLLEALDRDLAPYGLGLAEYEILSMLSEVPDQRLRYTDRFDDPNLPGTLEVTVSLQPVACGTELSVTQSGIPEAIPLEMCYLGWQESLLQLAALVEPDIAG